MNDATRLPTGNDVTAARAVMHARCPDAHFWFWRHEAGAYELRRRVGDELEIAMSAKDVKEAAHG